MAAWPHGSSLMLLARPPRCPVTAVHRSGPCPAAVGRRWTQRIHSNNDLKSVVTTSTENAPSNSSDGPSSSDANQQELQVDCVGTGMDVQCYVFEDDVASGNGFSQQSAPQSPLGLKTADVGQGQTAAETDTSWDPVEDNQQTQQQQQQRQKQQQAEAVVQAPATAAAAAAADNPLQQLLGVALLVSPFFFWGTSMVAMKPVTAHTTPLLLGAMRLLPAGLALVGWAAATGRPQPKTVAAWAWITAFALVDGAAFQGFLAEGLQRTSAGLGSVIIDSQPLSVAVLAALLFGEALSVLGVAGLFIGVAGLLLLEVPQDMLLQGLGSGAAGVQHSLAAMSSSSDGGSWSLVDSGEFWMLLAAQSMAVGTVMVRWVTKHCDPVAATAWHMVLGGAILAAAAVAADGDTGELAARLSQFDSSDALAMAYVSLFGGAASYGIFFYEATHGSLTAISSLTFLTPMFAAGAGFLVLGETLTPVQLLGAGITLAAVFMINTPASHKPTARKGADA